MELSEGERLELISSEHDGRGWYQVRHAGTGQRGWVHGNNIRFE
jgi:hypothetical protein